MMKQATVLLSVVLVLCSGCSAKWVNVAQADLPIAISLAEQIAALADPAAQAEIKEYGQEAAVDLQLVQQLITDYQKAPGATTAGKITAALTDAQNHMTAILAAVHVKNDVKSQHIAEAVGLVILTVNTIVQLMANAKTVKAANLPTPAQLQAELNTLVRLENGQ